MSDYIWQLKKENNELKKSIRLMNQIWFMGMILVFFMAFCLGFIVRNGM